MTGPELTDPQAGRLLGFWPTLALVVGTLVGTGIYLLPAQLAPFGWNAVLGWLVSIGGALCLALIFARLAHELPRPGGPYVHVELAFGRLPAFAVGWSYWVSLWTGNAAIAVGAVSYLSLFAPELASEPGLGGAVAAGLLALLTLLNALSLRAAGGFQLLTVLLKLLPLLAVILLAAAFLIAPDRPSAAPLPAGEGISLSAVNAAAALTLWAMLGIEAAAVSSRNVRDPARTIPRATVIGTLMVGALYLGVSTAIIFLLPAGDVSGSDAPIALFVERFWSDEAALLVGGFAAISAIGALNGFVLLSGEVPLAMARDGAFPAFFARTTRTGRPVAALILSALLSGLLILFNSSRTLGGLFAFIALLATAANLVLYFATAAASLELQRRNLLETRPWLLIVSGIGLLFALWTFHGAGFEPTGWAVVLIAAGLPVYILTRWLGSSRVRASAAGVPPE